MPITCPKVEALLSSSFTCWSRIDRCPHHLVVVSEQRRHLMGADGGNRLKVKLAILITHGSSPMDGSLISRGVDMCDVGEIRIELLLN